MSPSYLAIDLKSFYASVECVSRGLDPMTANLVVADERRTEKTICLAVSPALKAYGIPGRCRLFEVLQKVRSINAERRRNAPRHTFTGKSSNAAELAADPSLELDFLIAPPRMAKYMEVSARIYQIYLRSVAPEDIHVYSIDEVFIDAAPYLSLYRMTAREFTRKLITDVLRETGVTAAAGIGTNLYLAKIAMDIEAKHSPADRDGVRIAELDELTYRQKLWDHRPLTDFWRVGRGISSKLESIGIHTMGDIARVSLTDEDFLYRLFGVNAELLIDHAWGWEPCTMAAIKSYKPESRSLSSGQVLSHPYDFEKGRLIVREMTDLLVLDLVEKNLVTDQMILTVCYEGLHDAKFEGELTSDRYGRTVPKEAHGSVNLGRFTSSTRLILEAVTELYGRIVNPKLSVRRLYVVANHVMNPADVPKDFMGEQLDLFFDAEAAEREREEENRALEREKNVQHTVLDIKKKFGKNAILRGMNLEEGSTARERNGQVGGHKA